ncbi:hypothetical protein J437_LFUL001776 [Ladona fulva]|uniref:PiggyBac transposable element-derived protein domain-containing protein n=1 Tax=Ladona fulva TaxID=123851 RepID=A0A8K0NVU9_LADFU|nr:hypothetical protein J437_LFUL001776 [Ladona fulva]
MASTSGGASCGMTDKDIYEELCVDELSDVPDDCVEECESSDSEIGYAIDGRKPNRKAAQLVYTDDSDSEVSDSDGSLVKDSSVTWSKIDLPRSLEDFQGVAGITNAPVICSAGTDLNKFGIPFQNYPEIWHFSDNESNSESSDRLHKIRPILAYFLEKFKTVYMPKRDLSLNEGVIPWRGRLRFRTYNPGKLVKYRLLVRMLCESETGYICNIEIYTAEGKKLEETILTLLDPYLHRWHHVFQDNYYNSVKIAENLLEKKTRVYGTIRANRGLPTEFRHEIKSLKKGEYAFCRRGEVMLLTWKDKREVRMISTIHNSSMGEGKRNRWTGDIQKKPTCILEYNKYMGGVDRADMYLAYFSVLRKTMKWTKKVVLWLISSALFNSFVVYKTLNTTTLAKGWAKCEEGKSASSSNDDTDGRRERPTQRALRRDNPARLEGGMVRHTLERIVGYGKKKYPSRMCRVCSANKLKKETRYICGFCKVPLHKGQCFTKYHTKTKYKNLW